jgi:hypothetical protein
MRREQLKGATRVDKDSQRDPALRSQSKLLVSAHRIAHVVMRPPFFNTSLLAYDAFGEMKRILRLKGAKIVTGARATC